MTENNTLYDCIIVGAGMSGLAAANLLQHKKQKVLVLEARDRIGGRIDTDTSWGAPVEMGAAWIHGIKGNPLYELAKQFQLPLIESDYHATGNVITHENQILSAKESKKYFETYRECIHMLEDYQGEETMQVFLQKFIQQSPNKQLPDIENWIQHILSCREGVELNAIRSYEQQDYIEFPGKHMIFAGGYSELLTNYSENLKIHFKHQVTDIRQTDDRVFVKTGDQQYQAKQVIVTIPLGVLKEKTLSFSPPLPQQKQDAIDHLGMGMLNKIALHFPTNFWQEKIDTCFMQLLSSDSDEVIWLANIAHYTNKPILLAYFPGEQAIQLEGPQQARYVNLIMDRLQQIFPKTAVDPIEIKISAWQQDPFARGAYMYVPPGQSATLCDALAKPFNRVYFAGDATDRHHYSNVHAALFSGKRAATEILLQK